MTREPWYVVSARRPRRLWPRRRPIDRHIIEYALRRAAFGPGCWRTSADGREWQEGVQRVARDYYEAEFGPLDSHEHAENIAPPVEKTPAFLAWPELLDEADGGEAGL